MTLQEMIEMAILDAMGLLDDDERELFEAAFRACAPAVQAQVRREQTRLSQIEMLLPDVSPPAGLRALVIQAVRNEMSRATSGKSADLLVPSLVPSRGVSPIWRAASLGLLAAVLVLGVTMFTIQAQHQSLTEKLQSNAIEQALKDEFGTPFVMDVLFRPDTERVLFAPVANGFKGQATIVVNPEWNDARFFCKDIITPKGRTYRLAIIDEDNRVIRELKEFTSDGGLVNERVPLQYGAGNTIAILGFDEANQLKVISKGKLQG